MPVWRGWSVRTHSRIEEVKCFFTSGCGGDSEDGDVFMMLPFSVWSAYVRCWCSRRSAGEELDRDVGKLVVELEDAAVA
jgi:hypothetical protein